MSHHCFTCPLCGECYFCLGEQGASCLCEEPMTPGMYGHDVRRELRAERARAARRERK
jgi:hypothetical protein